MKREFTHKSWRMLVLTMLLYFIGAECSTLFAQEHSVAMQWNEVQLQCIRKDRPRPTVQARNLCHAAIVMWDAWAAYDDCASTVLLGKTWGNYTCPFDGIQVPEDIEAAREEALSFAMYRFLYHRYLTAPVIVPNTAGQQAAVTGYINNLMTSLGYDPSITSTDYTDGDPAKLGNYIAAKMQEYGLQDGANQNGGGTGYANQYYVPANTEPLNPNFPGDPGLIYPNQWQPLCLGVACQQGTSIEQGNCVPEPVACNAPALTPEFGNVNPFAMTPADLMIIQRAGHDWKVYHDQGYPPYLDQLSYDGLESFFKWGYVMVAIWHSFHDPDDGVHVDISPNSLGNVPWYPESNNFEEYQDFYGMYDGTDPSTGYAVNPATGQPYAEQWVPRGDYTRVLSEFWADGPNSETPPGHWFTILNDKVTNHPDFEKRWMGEGEILSDLEWDVRSYLALGGGVMDAAIACWGAKGAYDYGRPIFVIRYMAERGQCSDPLQANYHPEGLPLIPGFIEVVEAGDPLQGMNGEHIGKIKIFTWSGPPAATSSSGVEWILGENWWTYQSASFVTPPFPGYMSGHSTYSRTAAEILTAITGDEFFPGGYGEFTANALTGLIAETGPSQTIHLQWARYIDASDQCSLSRIFGGLHPPQDDIPGRHIGMELGPEVVDKANSLINSTIPHIASITTSDDVISDANVGSDFTVTVTFSKPMNTGTNPTISFISDNPLSTLTQTGAMWQNATTFVLTYSVVDVNETKNNVIWKFSNAIGANAQVMVPGLSDAIKIDTQNPFVQNAVSDMGTLFNDEDALMAIQTVTLTFNETMDTSVKPAFSYPDEDPSNSIMYNEDESYWMDNMNYVAMFDVFDVNEEIQDIDVLINLGKDAAGNNQINMDAPDSFDIDTRNPNVDSFAVSDALISDSDSGSDFTITLIFDETMSTESNPSITFSEDVSATLTMTSGNWENTMTFIGTWSITDGNHEVASINVSSVSATDVAGNNMISFENAAVLSIDNRNPLATAIAVDDDVIADANEGSNGLTITITFDEPMSNADPSIEFPEGNLSSSLTFDDAASDWINANTFEAVYTVIDAGVEIWNIDITEVEALDLAGNVQTVQFGETDAFSIDTRNPQVTLATANTYNITSAFTGNGGFNIVALFDEAMDQNEEPAVSFPDEDPTSVITYSAGPSDWLNSTSFNSVYNVATDLITIQDIDIAVTGSKDAAGNDLVDYDFDDFFDIHTIVSVGDLDEMNGVKVFPNPVHSGETITIQWSDMPEELNISLYNLVGQQLTNESIKGMVSGKYLLETTGLSNGMYFVHLNSSKGQLILNVQIVK